METRMEKKSQIFSERKMRQERAPKSFQGARGEMHSCEHMPPPRPSPHTHTYSSLPSQEFDDSKEAEAARVL